MTNWNGALEAKRAMPGCRIASRVCYGTHDQTPRGLLRRLLGLPGKVDVRAPFGPSTVKRRGLLGGVNWTGQAWFDKFWPDLSKNVGADIYVFTNEWTGNRSTHEEIDAFCRFYMQLGDVCTPRGITCTFGDLSVGTPGYPTIPEEAYDVIAFQPMLSQAERQGHYLNAHGYDLHQGDGLVPREYSILRYKTLTKGHPNLKVIAGELANDAPDVGHRDGLYGGIKSLDMMKAFYALLKDDPQFLGGCWWLICDGPIYANSPEARWDKDDFSPILNAYFDWVIEAAADESPVAPLAFPATA